ncbi:PadR family transcriptional regulator [Burkholderia lata]|jgi:DNA-binding PadR family transcriptional regulator|uniref:PadR family transcriptional regulator n=2 Tax=Burkholderia TaxID=32008 RepID=UPI001581A6B1|nr:PadR family transcriptional regulator [Burkholderia lata]MBN3772482.1 PadR family transcriptional regulator [Burkholderia sp. Se-20378]MBN3796402.1 PadR family transcriptional regulator [Burkholderia sp. Ac-20392]
MEASHAILRYQDPQLKPRSRQPSPLAMVILGFVLEAPSHAYRMHELIRQRGKDNVVNVAQRNSVYQTLSQLKTAELIRVRETAQGEGRPERVVYEITPLGRKTFYAWLEAMLGEPRREFNEFPAALATIMALTPEVVRTQLQQRSETLKQQLSESVSTFRTWQDKGLPRLVMLDDEYKQVLLNAEIQWLDGLISELESGAMTWNEKYLRELAAQFG